MECAKDLDLDGDDTSNLNFLKFNIWVLELDIGQECFHTSHSEIKEYFGLTEQTAQGKVWLFC